MNKYKSLKIKGSRIDEHRKIVQDLIGRKLSKNEVVHHINGDKSDNRIENLQILSRSEHAKLHLKNRKLGDITKKKISNKLKGKPRPNARKLSIEKVEFIKNHYIPRDKKFGARALSRMFNISKCAILNCLKREE